MKIVLLESVENLGEKFETVNVKAGYGRNFLIPKKLAVVANKPNSNMAAERLKQIRMKEDKVLDQLKAVISKIEGAAISVGAKVGTTGKIFGSVTNVQIADAIKQLTGQEVDRKKITILDEVKMLGKYQAELVLHRDVKHTFEFEVVGE
ncbi:UNVERIFIED_CONTAM: hypothetical protein GTU68_010643 [Idotea baltica]|nr:hypothetical protein [Idotea baltica]